MQEFRDQVGCFEFTDSKTRVAWLFYAGSFLPGPTQRFEIEAPSSESMDLYSLGSMGYIMGRLGGGHCSYPFRVSAYSLVGVTQSGAVRILFAPVTLSVSPEEV